MTTKEYQSRTDLQILLHFFRPHIRLFLLDMLCALMIALVDLAFPYVSRLCLHRLIPESQYQTFFLVILLFLGIYLVRSFFQYIVCYWGHTFGVRVEADIRRALFDHLQTLSFGFYDRNRTGHLMSRMTAELFDITELAHHGPEDLLISCVTILGALALMFSIRWQLALVVLLIIPAFLLVITRNRVSMSKSARAVKQAMSAINADVESTLSGIRTAKAFSNEEAENHKFSGANDRFKTAKQGFFHAMGVYNGSMEFFLCLLPVVVIAGGGILIMQGKMDLVDLITFSLFTTSFVTPMRKLSTMSELIANGFAGLSRFTELMRLEPELKDLPDARDLTVRGGEIQVRDVCFAYGENSEEVLHHVDLRVAPGETVAIVGPSGGGKSTLCNLIPRFYDVQEGSILVDGQDVRQVTQQSLRRNIGVVQQEVFLFAASILDNIRYGRPDASMYDVVLAAKKAEIYDDIMAMPQGFDTFVGERGALLSGGQKQRISIARIFLKNPPILILDEATSALDSLTEARIQHAFDALAKGRTTLVIAHRLSTVRNASRILVMEEGRITESGTHEKLLKKGGAYAKLYETQNLK